MQRPTTLAVSQLLFDFMEGVPNVVRTTHIELAQLPDEDVFEDKSKVETLPTYLL